MTKEIIVITETIVITGIIVIIVNTNNVALAKDLAPKGHNTPQDPVVVVPAAANSNKGAVGLVVAGLVVANSNKGVVDLAAGVVPEGHKADPWEEECPQEGLEALVMTENSW